VLNWDDVRVFLALCRENTLAGAGRRLRVDETTVGRRLASLEEALGSRLFLRTPEGMRVSPEGRGILARAEQVEELLLGMERQVAGGDARIEGPVRLTCPESMAAFLAARLGRVRQAHPALQLEVSGSVGRTNLSRREADVAVRMARPEQPNLVARKLGAVSFAPYASHHYLARNGKPRAGRGLRGLDVLGFSDELAPTPSARWLQGVLDGALPAFKGGSFSVLRAAALAGMGVAVLPCFLAEEGLERLPEGIVASSTAWLVVHEDMVGNARVRAVMQAVGEVFREEQRLFRGS
jgi:DNA-binding transcriptional LysR family regulator